MLVYYLASELAGSLLSPLSSCDSLFFAELSGFSSVSVPLGGGGEALFSLAKSTPSRTSVSSVFVSLGGAGKALLTSFDLMMSLR